MALAQVVPGGTRSGATLLATTSPMNSTRGAVQPAGAVPGGRGLHYGLAAPWMTRPKPQAAEGVAPR